jgi:hypothetical protein
MVTRVDHLLYVTPELERGMDEIEGLLGMRPVSGGRHPGYGTHNALLSLGPATYLEVIAPDPEAPTPERGVLFGMHGIRESRIATWVLRAEAIEDVSATAASAGLGLGPIHSGGREKPDGTVVSWWGFASSIRSLTGFGRLSRCST